MQNSWKIGCFFLVLLFIAPICWFFWARNLDFNLVYTYERSSDQIQGWKTICDNGFWTDDMFASEFKDETGKSVYTEFNFDVSEYTYVVCYGYNLKKLTFSKANVSGSFSNPTYYYGKAYLEKNENPNVVNIYMIRKISIENDPHSNTDEFTVVLQ